MILYDSLWSFWIYESIKHTYVLFDKTVIIQYILSQITSWFYQKLMSHRKIIVCVIEIKILYMQELLNKNYNINKYKNKKSHKKKKHWIQKSL